MSEYQKPCQSPGMANGRCRIHGGTSQGMIALLANLILFSTLITILPARADCSSSIEDARSIARNIVVSIDAKKPVPAGTPIQIAWSYKNSAEFHHPQVPTYVVITAPVEVRLAGNNFVAFTAGAEAPYHISYGHAGSRAFFSLHRTTDTAQSGRLSIKPYLTGIRAYGWAVVTAGACGEQILSQGTEAVETTPGRAQLVIQNKFSTEKPIRRILSKATTHELLIFSGRYEVHAVATGAKVIDRPGVDPNFSPTGRFVGARVTAEGPLEIFDLISGTLVREYVNHFLAWARGDSFIAAGGSMWGIMSLDNAIVDQGEILAANVGCHACDAWTTTQLVLDTDRGFVAAVGSQELEIRDIFTRQGLSQDNFSQTPTSELGLRYVRQTYDPEYPQFPSVWSLGEKIALSHTFRDATSAKTQLRFLVRHNDITTAQLPNSQASAEQLTGRKIFHQQVSSTAPPKTSDIFSRLADAGIATRAPLPITQIKFGDDLTKISERAQRQALVVDMAREFPDIKNAFRRAPAQCSFNALNAGEVAIDPDWIAQAYRWREASDNAWLVQAICYAGSASIVNAADLLVVRKSAGGGKIQSIIDLLGKNAFAGTSEISDSLKAKVYRDDDQRIIVISPSGAFAAVVNLETNKREGAVISMAETALVLEARRTIDGRYLIQTNSDGRLFVYRVSDGRRVLDGAYVDDEIVIMTDDGRYDTTYEGAYSVQVRFAGVHGLFLFSQFDALLRRPGLASIILGGGDLPPAPIINAPPSLELSLQLVLKDGQRTGRVIAFGEHELSSIRMYVDGRKIREFPVNGRRVDIPVAFTDPGGGRWVSAVAIDTQGLVSLPSAILLPGSARPSGVARVVAIGVDKYVDPQIATLSSAVVDAKHFIQAMATTEGNSFTSVRSTALLDADVTPASVLDKINAAARETTATDTLFVYFAGHGVDGAKLNQGDAGLILATNLTRLADLASTSLRWKALADALSVSRGTVIVVLDACQSGIAGSEALTSNDAVVSELLTKSQAPIVVLAASKGRQASQETENAGGGRFTNALVSAISVERRNYDTDRSGLIDLAELYIGVKTRVVAETHGDQTPWLARNGLVGEISLF
jgi:hypothetical protein